MSQYATAPRARSPVLEELWRALFAKRPQGFRNLATAYTASVDEACAAAFLEARRAIDPRGDRSLAHAAREKAEAAKAEARGVSRILTSALPDLPSRSRPCLSPFLLSLGRTLVTADSVVPTPALTPEALPAITAALQPFAHASHMSIASLHNGTPLSEALALWTSVPVRYAPFPAHPGNPPSSSTSPKAAYAPSRPLAPCASLRPPPQVRPDT